jgi:hypothetical protein
MARLPDVLSAANLPYPELCAARLDGEVYRLDDSFSPIDVIDQPRHRARSLRSWAPAALIAERRTAAWIYGALDAPPVRHQFCVDTSARVRPDRTLRVSVREVVFGDGDVVRLDRLRITSPVRTVIDLARVPETSHNDAATLIARLALSWKVTLDECSALLDRRRNLPGKRKALAVIAAALEGELDLELTGAKPATGDQPAPNC